MADLSEDDTVAFSGKFIKADDCISEKSITDAGGMSSPEFVFKFTSLVKE